MATDEVGILGIFVLVLIHCLRGCGRKRWILRLQQRQHVWVCVQIIDCGDLILRDRIEENPAETVGVIMLVVTSKIVLVALGLTMERRPVEGRRLNATGRSGEAVQDIKP